jgi:PhoH-like ATPase
MKKLFIVDTNVLIYDPRAVLRLGDDNDILLPMGVIEELDKHKKGNDERGVASRTVVRLIDTILREGKSRGESLHEGITIDPERGPAKIFVPLSSEFSKPEEFINDSYVDNVILQIAKEMTERDNGYDEVSVITKDIALRIKGEAMSLQMDDYENSLIRAEEYYTDRAKEVVLSDDALSDIQTHGKMCMDDYYNLPVGLEEIPTNTYIYVKPQNSFSDEDETLCRVEGRNIIRVPVNRKSLYDVIRPRNNEQAFLIDALLNPKIQLIAVPGPAGTGKTLLSLAAALEQVVNLKMYNKVIVMRPMVSVGKEMGFLPGDLTEKLSPWMAPVYDALEILHPNLGKASLESLHIFKLLEFQAIALIRGRSISEAFIIVDEAQNLTPHEIKTIVSRAGEGTKIVLTGDVFQIDSPYLDERSNGLSHVIKQMDGEPLFAYVNMIHSERSDLAELASKKL